MNYQEDFKKLYRKIKIILGVTIMVFLSLYSILVVEALEPPFKYILIHDSDDGYIPIHTKLKTVKQILNKYQIEIDEDDLINYELDDILKDGMRIDIVHRIVEIENREIIVEKQFLEVIDQTIPLFEEVYEAGQNGLLKQKVEVITINNEKFETILEKVEDTPKIDETKKYSSVEVGSYFIGKLTAYGVDCVGCSGRNNGGYGAVAAGLSVSKYGVNDSWKVTVNVKGKEYFVLAADKSIPFCTVIQIENHNLKDAQGQLYGPVEGIVLDRGGGINGAHIDIFKGPELDYGDVNGSSFLNNGTKNDVRFTILKLGSGNRNCYTSSSPWQE